ncbi:LysR family transcriptional regulator [Niveispirillum sp. SYP-B3756]|uniref:LysR substrate-binding domain-containing protein n=1 Tax=Niveispirillum sp. SYP-B3756 TaxID=2662178 RepID=UPI001290F5A6|nr:LysR substrate-binding domain-containing protein [Niveispirillum sp. SYP-B3756]MQP68297.1 LysR family transcriptional regulator [Niveispirillum sp. SYP-B3756]
MTGRLPSLRGIEAFVCVAEVLNLRVASERLNVSISAVSHRIQALEEELGVKLFVRGKRALQLSPAGSDYLERLKPGLQALRAATHAARDDVHSPVLRIAGPSFFFDQWLLPRLDNFRKDWPKIRIELLTLGRKRATGTDVTILPMSPSAIHDGAEPLFELLVTPVCTPAFASRYELRQIRDLLTVPLIDIVPSSNAWSLLFLAAGLEAEVPEPAYAADSPVTLCQMALNGLGVALAANVLVDAHLRQGLLMRPFDIGCVVPTAFGLVAREWDARSMARAFVRWLRAEMAASVQFSSTVGQEIEIPPHDAAP